ncbi:serine protease, putative, partial [Ixodes scapularis]
VKEVIMHNSFDLETLSNDIALVKLRIPFYIEESEGHIGAICIPKKMFTIMNKVTVTGWGKISANGPISADMHAAVVPVKKDLICRRHNEGYNSQSMFCAGTSGKESCE